MSAGRGGAIALAIAAMTCVSVALAPSAHAQSNSVSSGVSAKKGWGVAELVDEGDGLTTLYACDEGRPDGLRARAYLYVDGKRVGADQDASGSDGRCGVGKSLQFVTSPGDHYRLEACLRDGANGADVLCRSTTGVIS